MRLRTLTALVVLLLVGAGSRAADAAIFVIAMDQQINIGLGNAILPDTKTLAGLDRITFESEGGVGFTRMHFVADNGMNDWYEGPFIDLIRAGIGALDLSRPGSSIEFDARYYQAPEDYPDGRPWTDHDAPIGVYLHGAPGWREFAFPYHSMWGDPPYPSWTHVVLDANAEPALKVNVISYGGLNMANVVGLGFFGTNWPGLGNDFIDVKAVTINGAPASAVPEPSTLVLGTTALAGAIGLARRRRRP